MPAEADGEAVQVDRRFRFVSHDRRHAHLCEALGRPSEQDVATVNSVLPFLSTYRDRLYRRQIRDLVVEDVLVGHVLGEACTEVLLRLASQAPVEHTHLAESLELNSAWTV